MEKFLREPLVQFMAIGAVLFGVFHLVGQWNPEKPRQIVVSSERINTLKEGFVFDFGRPPLQADIEKLIDEYIREEVFVQEAIKLDYPRTDQNIRIELRKRMESAAAMFPAATEQDLQAFLNANPEKFRPTPDAPVPPLSQIRPTVHSVWQATRRAEMIDAAYQRYRKGYNVVIQMPPATQATSNPQ